MGPCQSWVASFHHLAGQNRYLRFAVNAVVCRFPKPGCVGNRPGRPGGLLMQLQVLLGLKSSHSVPSPCYSLYSPEATWRCSCRRSRRSSGGGRRRCGRRGCGGRCRRVVVLLSSCWCGSVPSSQPCCAFPNQPPRKIASGAASYATRHLGSAAPNLCCAIIAVRYRNKAE